jgi:cytochrome P450 family 135
VSSVHLPLLPPGPRMGRLAGTVAFHRDPVRFLRAAQHYYGDVFTIRLLTAAPVVVIADPEAAAGLATLDSGAAGAAAHAGEARQAVLPMASSTSVFGGDEHEHHRSRARAYPCFSPEAIAQRSEQIAALAQRHISTWPRGRPIRLLPRMRRLADEVFVREILRISDEARAEELTRAIGRLLYTPGNPPLTIPAPEDGLLGRAVDAIYRWRRAPIARLISQELTERRTEGSSCPGLLGQLLADEPARDNRGIVEELLSLLMAAQEPMASALTWLVLTIACAHEVQERIADAPAGDDYERAVIQESLRLHPPALGMLRRLTQPATLAGQELPANTSTMAPIPLLQSDPRSFEQPERFLPERHLAGHADGLGSRMWPFGHGARRCIAEPLACTLLGAVMRALLRDAAIRPLGAQPERPVLRATILVPRRSGLVLLLPPGASTRCYRPPGAAGPA